MEYAINILDQSPICENETAADALQATIELSKMAESLGYKRFWVAEHHNMNQLVGVSPEVLISHLLAHTHTIQIGSGGVMLQHYSPYKVAENFHLLDNLAPRRVNLGIGKAPGGLNLSTDALQYGKLAVEIDFVEKVTLLKAFLNQELPKNHKLSGVEAIPLPKENLDLFLLGGSVHSAKLAGELESHFVFARFLNPSNEVLAEIGDWHMNENKQKLIIAVAVLAAETKERADELAREIKMFEVLFADGKKLSLQSKEHVEALKHQTKQPFTVTEKKITVIAGTPDMIKSELDALHLNYMVDEFIFHTPLHNRAARLESFKLLGEYYQKRGETDEKKTN